MSESPQDTVEATLNFLAPDSRVNRRFVFLGEEVNTGRFEPHRVTICNARRAAEPVTFETHGFALYPHRSAVANFKDRAELDAVYVTETLEAVKALTGADAVAPIGYVLRTSADTRDGAAQPTASDVHVDFSPRSGPSTAKFFWPQLDLPDRAYRRSLITSFWRAFSPPPQDWPLAVCDGRSVGPEEGVTNVLLPVEKRPTREEMFGPIPGEDDLPSATSFPFRPHHRWFYYPDMDRDEALLLTLNDSDHSRVWRTPHTAFRDESRARPHVRESIEFRSVAYFF